MEVKEKSDMKPLTLDLVEKRMEELKRARDDHFEAERAFIKQNTCITIVEIVSSAFAASGLALGLGNYEVPFFVAVSFFASGLIAVITSSLSKFQGIPERAHRHHWTASEYAKIIREIERFQSVESSEATEAEQFLNNIDEKRDVVTSQAPVLPKYSKLLAQKTEPF